MKVVILAGGYGTRLWPLTKEIPKCFLEFGQKKVIERILDKTRSIREVDQVYISTNRKFQVQFESWLENYSYPIPIQLFIENASEEKDKLGAIRSLEFFLEQKGITDDLLVIAGDNLFECDLRPFVDSMRKSGVIQLAINNVRTFESKQKLGVVEVDSNNRVRSFTEKPENPTSTLVCTGLYLFPKNQLKCFGNYLKAKNPSDNLGFLFEWLLKEKVELGAWHFNEDWYDIGTFKPFQEALEHYSRYDSRPVRVLVTGGAGYLGGLLVPMLARDGFLVRVVDRLFYDFAPDDQVEFIEGDIRDRGLIENCLEDVDFVVHLAGLSNDPSCDLSLNETVEINYIGTKVVTELAAEAGVKRIIFPSSCSVYGSTDSDVPVTEGAPLNPVSLYAQMKAASELQIRSLTNDRTDTCCLRFATLYGHSPNMRFDLIANVIPIEALVDKTIKLFGGSQYRPLLHTRDAAAAIIAAINYDDRFEGKCFNIGSDENNYSVRELTEKLQKNIFSEVPVKEFPEKTDPRSYRVSFSAFQETTGFKTSVDLIEGVNEIAENIKSGRYGNVRDDSRYFRVTHLKNKGLDTISYLEMSR